MPGGISKRKVKTVERSVFDSDGIEIHNEVEHTFYIKDLNKKYTIMFSHFAKMFSELQHNESKVMVWLADSAAYNNPVVVVNKVIREQISEEMNISRHSIMPTLTGLVKKGFLERMGTERSSTYQINPKYFWRGDMAARNTLLKPMLTEG